ncbi:MAG: class I SAM-dependent methyltransferase, partial [Planctomycetota bacterium]
ADDPTLPSLNHPQRDPYALIESDIDDFAVIYSYPWPGEEWFHRDVFDRHAREHAIHLQFLGPNDVCAFRKLGGI